MNSRFTGDSYFLLIFLKMYYFGDLNVFLKIQKNEHISNTNGKWIID